MRLQRSTMAILAVGTTLATTAMSGLIPVPTGPKPGFEVFSVDAKGGGWIINHMPGRGDTLWGCKDVSTPATCTQVYFDEWKTASKLHFIHVTDKSQKGWLKLSAPAMGDFLYACSDPEATPVCKKIALELRPDGASFDRVWPYYDCEFECGDKGPCCGEGLPETDTRRRIETADKGDMLLELGLILPGPSNLYACKGLESNPECILTIPNWLALDRQDIGFKTLEDIETENPDGSITYGPGVMVGKIDEDTVVDRAGIREGDVILKVGEFETSRAKHARYLMLQYPAEATIPLTMGDGKVVELKVSRKPKGKK